MNVTPKEQAPDITSIDKSRDVPTHRKKVLPSLHLDRFSGVYALVLLVIIFGLWIPDLFLTTTTFQSVLVGQAVVGMAALAVLVPLAASAFDLSIAAVISLSVVVVARLQSVNDWSPWAAILVTVFVAALIGAINGFSIVVLQINSFIATLAMSSILAALIFWISGGQQIVTGISPSFTALGQNELFGIALPVYYLLALAVALYVVLQYTPLGRFIFAVGENVDASRLAGIRTGRVTFLAMVFSSTIAGLAGVLLCARIGSASLDAGAAYLLPAFAAAFLGSTQIKPGRMNVWGTILAVYLLAVGVKGLQLAGAAPWVDQLFNGFALLIAVAVSVYARRRKQAT